VKRGRHFDCNGPVVIGYKLLKLFDIENFLGLSNKDIFRINTRRTCSYTNKYMYLIKYIS